MTQHNFTDPPDPLASTACVPLSERPLVAEDDRTVISSPEGARSETAPPAAPAPGEHLLHSLFPANGVSTGDEAGVRLAHFEIRQRLGAGGMGAVFRAADLELARDVALKILHPGPSRDPSLVARFRNEARACAQLSHDNIARVYYAGTQDGLYFIAYEFASGRTIRDLILERGRLPVAEAVNYAIQVTLALNHISAAGIVHRDIKPSNIMLTDSGRVKVVDLGLARRDMEDSIGEITVAGTTLGTFDYLAPEQARDPRNADVRSDIYSLGCTIYHMVTGQPPYPEGTALQKLLDHQGKAPPDPRLINARVPGELAAILKRMMANVPEQRYQAAPALLSDLMHLAARLGLQSVPAEGIVWRSRQSGGNAGLPGAAWLLGTVMTICITALILQYFSGSNGARQTALMRPAATLDPRDFQPQQNSPAVATAASADNPPAQPKEPEQEPGPPAEAAAAMANSKTPAPSLLTNSPVRLPLSVLPAPGLPAPLIFPLGIPPEITPDPSTAAAAATAAPAAATELQGPFVLQQAGRKSRSFRTLKAAVADATSGDVILLQYNGYPDDLPAQPPVRIVDMNLIVRAADGYRPTLEFDGVAESSLEPGQMFSLLSGGALTIRDIDLRMIVRDDQNVDHWSMFHLSGTNRVSLENVCLECANPSGRPASLFELAGDSVTPGELPEEETEIALNRVTCRAQADAFYIPSQPRGRIRMVGCGMVLQGRLMDVRGDGSMQNARGLLEVFAEHLTCMHTGPLIHASDMDPQQPLSSQRLLPRISVRSEASVYKALSAEATLLRSDGNSWIEELESLLIWNGFTNLYDNYSMFWIIETANLDFAGRRLDFRGWQEHWQKRTDGEDTAAEVSGGEIWRFPLTSPDNIPDLSTVVPANFELDAALFLSGTRNTFPRARDGLIPGVNPQELPAFPKSRPQTSDTPPDTAPPDMPMPLLMPAGK